MIPLLTFFELQNQEFMEQKFLDDFRDECHNIGVGGYFGIMMVINNQHIAPLITVSRKYMHDLLGLRIPDIPVIPYTTPESLPPEHMMSGFFAVGFYVRKTNQIFIKNGMHLNKLIPTVFHELTHAYVHNNGIVIIDNFKVPQTVTFDFVSLMHKASQEEGLCELVMTLMRYHIFKTNEYPSTSEEYCLGWVLHIHTFLNLGNIFRQIKPHADNLEISRLALSSIITYYKNNNNIYKFVDKVPKDAYHQARKVF